MKIFTTIADLKKDIEMAGKAGASVGLVPTMGALHAGHGSLIEAACNENGYVVVSNFINPTQFGPNEDLASYPRDMEGDCRLAREIGAQAVFAPAVEEMYPEGSSPVWVEVKGRLSSILCGLSRPGHFRGVTTVVAKLFNIVGPCRAYFGQKDGQQAQIICRMARDLFMPVEMRILPIIREIDGLALSSRNAYLSVEERRAALVLPRALAEASEMIGRGEKNKERILAYVRDKIVAEPLAQLDYVEIYTFPGLEELPEQISGKIMLAAAVKFGGARLIDNQVLDC